MINQSKTNLYKVWSKMKCRCVNSNNPKYKNYGARGIKVCDRWMNSFESFLEDMGEQPEGTSLDRINNDGDYEPSNCRWATSEQQNNNKRNTAYLTYNGKTQSLTQWARELEIAKTSLQNRLLRGWSLEKALSTPATAPNQTILSWNGKTQTLNEWAAELEVNSNALLKRLHRGWSVEKVLSTPMKRAA